MPAGKCDLLTHTHGMKPLKTHGTLSPLSYPPFLLLFLPSCSWHSSLILASISILSSSSSLPLTTPPPHTKVQMFAPDMDQMHVINHCEGKPSEEKRNVLQESARIARGEVKDLSTLETTAFDAIIIPGEMKLKVNCSVMPIILIPILPSVSL